MDLRTRSRVWRAGRLETENFPADRLREYLAQDDAVVWLDLTAPRTDDLHEIADELGLDPVAVEDAVSHRERSKLDRYARYLFLNVYSVRLDAASGRLMTWELSAFITDRVFLTVHPNDDCDISALVAQWDGSAHLAPYGVAYLLHGLLDYVVDQHFDAVQTLDAEIDGLEELLFEGKLLDREAQRRSYELRKSLTHLRRVVLPMREIVNTLLRRDLPVIPREMAPYFQDVYDHTLQANEWTDSLRDVVTNLYETRIAMQGNHLNEVMKKLTGWAAIIAVPTAVTGFYGENVPYPGFGREWGFFASLALLVFSAVTLYILFKKRDWL